jgi:hypothetical protein
VGGPALALGERNPRLKQSKEERKMESVQYLIFAGLLILGYMDATVSQAFRPDLDLVAREINPPEAAAETAVYFSRPVAIVYDQTHIFILDARDNDIKVFSKTGRFEVALGRKGEGPGEFSRPSDMDILGERIYVADGGNRRVQILDKNGAYQGGFKVSFPPWRILALDEERIIVAHLPSGFAGPEKVVHGFNSRGEILWEVLPSLVSGEPVHDAMQNQLFLRKGPRGDFFVIRILNDRLIRHFNRDGYLLGEKPVPAAQYPFQEISIPGRAGRKSTLKGFCWNCTTDGESLYLLIPEYSADKDLGPGRRIAAIGPAGNVEARIELPERISRLAVEGDTIYGIDLELRLRIFTVVEK